MIKRYFYIFCASMFIMLAPSKGINAKVLEKKLLELERHQKAPPGPQGINYQASLRGSDGNILANSAVTIRFSIQTAIDNSGTLEWEETHSISTSETGLVSTVIGQGTRTSGAQTDFINIPWSSTHMFLKVEMDQGTGFVSLGTTQLMSVPYAFAADNGISDEQATKLANVEDGAEINVQPDWNQTDVTSDDFIIGKPIVPTDINQLSDASGLLSPNSFSGSFDDLTNIPADLADGDDVDDADSDSANEIQDLQLVGNNLTITNNGSATTIDLSTYLDDTDTNTQLGESEVDAFVSNNGYLTSEVDGDASNEIQDLQLVGNNLTITNNGSATTIDLSPYLDDTDTNTQLSESEVDAFVANNGYLTSEVDGDPSNEIQDLQLVGNNLTITNNGSATTIDLSAYLDDTDTNTQLSESEVDAFVANNGYLTSEVDGDASNEIQDLQLVGNNLTITNNGSATTIDLSAYLDDTDTNTQLSESEVDAFVSNNGYLTSEVDGDTSNEIQDLQLVGNNLTITNNGSATTIDLSAYLDDTDTNTQLSESEVDAFVANNGYLTSEVDGDASNEIQDLQLVGNNLTITNNGSATTIDLSAYLDDTDTDTQLTESEVDAFVANNGYLTSQTFNSTSNLIINADPANESFLVGSSQFNDDGDVTHDKRMFFDKATGAFRVGGVQSTQWDSRGNYSFAAGQNNLASGNRSTVGGGFSNGVYSSYSTVGGGSYNRIMGSGSFGSTIAGGYVNYISGDYATIGGGRANYSTNGYATVAGGRENYAAGQYSAIPGGNGLRTNSMTEVAIGQFNTTPAGSASMFIQTDRLFTIGNGTNNGNRSDALVMLKNGNTTLNGQLTLSDGSNPFTFPNSDGTSGQALITDGSGALSWQNAGGAFSSALNIISNSDLANESFIVGSTQFNDDGDITHDKRMFFEKSTGSFRVGGVQSTEWDSRGTYSFAAGRNNLASGNLSTIGGGSLNISSSSHTVVAGGYGNYATDSYATVVGGNGNNASSGGAFIGGGAMNVASNPYTTISGGYGNNTTGEYSAIGGGRFNTTNGRRSTVPGGYRLIANSFVETAIGIWNNDTPGTANSFVATDQLFVVGNGTSSGSRSDALVMLKNGNTTLNGSLEVNTTTGAFILPRLTTTERDAIASPVNGMLIYNTTTNQIEGYENGTWIDI